MYILTKLNNKGSGNNVKITPRKMSTVTLNISVTYWIAKY